MRRLYHELAVAVLHRSLYITASRVTLCKRIHSNFIGKPNSFFSFKNWIQTLKPRYYTTSLFWDMDQASTTQDMENSIEGTTDITIKLHDLQKSDELINTILPQADLLSRITKIKIETRPLPDDEHTADPNGSEEAKSTSSATSDDNIEEASESDPADEKMDRLCTPLIELLSAVLAKGGSLHSFIWASEDDIWDYGGIRPARFWSALYGHSRTLHTLSLGFFTHEVHETLPAEVAFPNLKVLNINACTAHGDNGAAIEALLKNSPNLEILRFDWPGCDLPSCQIKNISWDYTFPSLHTLSVRGSDFAPAAFAAFLSRCTEVKIFYDGEDADSALSDDEDASATILEASTLPNLSILGMAAHRTSRSIDDWFDPVAHRPIRYLKIESSFGTQHILRELANSNPEAKARLEVLSIAGYEGMWRPREPDSDDEEEVRRAFEESDKLSDTARVLKNILPHLSGLKELEVGMQSGNTIYRDESTGEWVNPPPASEKDLKTILSLLPSSSRLHTLKVSDRRGAALSNEFLNGLDNIPEGLECLSWDGEKSVLYKIERMDGRTSIVPCEQPKPEDVSMDWRAGPVFGAL